MTTMATTRLICHSPEESQSLAHALARCLRVGDVVGLEGELGSGKTTFTQGLVSAFNGGDKADVSSPTFAIMNLYPTEPPVHHLDFYRLADLDDLETTGYWDLLQRGDTIVVVEWSDRIPDALDHDAWRVFLSFLGADARQIDIQAPSHRLADLKAQITADPCIGPIE